MDTYVVEYRKLPGTNDYYYFVTDSRLDMWVCYFSDEEKAQQDADKRNKRIVNNWVCPVCNGTGLTGVTDGGFTPCPECDGNAVSSFIDELPF